MNGGDTFGAGGIFCIFKYGYQYGDRMVSETIFGSDSVVIATKDGIVEGLFDIGDIKAVMIRKGGIFLHLCESGYGFCQEGKIDPFGRNYRNLFAKRARFCYFGCKWK
jgi:hypothetical protein